MVTASVMKGLKVDKSLKVFLMFFFFFKGVYVCLVGIYVMVAFPFLREN